MFKMPTQEEVIEIRNQQQIQTKQEIREFNKPYKKSVAINCCHIGDDNDYSCFLSDVIQIVYATNKEMAHKLFRTDSMVIDNNISFESFCTHIEASIQRKIEIEEMHKLQDKFYRD